MLRAEEAPRQADRHTSEEYFSGLFSLCFVDLPKDLFGHTDGASEEERWPLLRLWHVQVCVDQFDLDRGRDRERDGHRHNEHTQGPSGGSQDMIFCFFIECNGQLMDTLEMNECLDCSTRLVSTLEMITAMARLSVCAAV